MHPSLVSETLDYVVSRIQRMEDTFPGHFYEFRASDSMAPAEFTYAFYSLELAKKALRYLRITRRFDAGFRYIMTETHNICWYPETLRNANGYFSGHRLEVEFRLPSEVAAWFSALPYTAGASYVAGSKTSAFYRYTRAIRRAYDRMGKDMGHD